MENLSFSDIAIVACGTMSMELNHLKKEGFLDTEYLYFTTPGLHQDINELERQLVRQINKAKGKTDKIIVVYGGKFCYVNPENPLRTMQNIIEEQGPGVLRIQATHCMNVITREADCEKLHRKLLVMDFIFPGNDLKLFPECLTIIGTVI